MRCIDDKDNARFLIQILYQHNSTWQGRIVWLNAKKTVPFRSFLEMIHLVKEALGHDAAAVVEELERWRSVEEVL
ncbi:MAG: hypothetical protein ACM3QW_10570 [Ignavibacteriales bacterium]